MYCFTVMHRNTPVAYVSVSDDHKLVTPDALVMVAGSSIGTQKKFYEHGYWYKQNNLGYEGTAEYLSSVVLSCSNIDRYVTYERCTINGCPGCRSANFLAEGETYVSLERQALEAGIGLKLNYHALREKLQKEPASRALDVLWMQLEKYESLLQDDGLSKCTSSHQP